MDQAKAYGEYHRCLTELEQLYHDIPPEQWDRCHRPGWRHPAERIRWMRELREMKKQLEFAS